MPELDADGAVAALYARIPTRMGPTLERMQDLAELLDHPQRSAPVVHLTGTNGKTTTARMISSVFAALGLGAGTYTSPHLTDVRERISVAGRLITPEELAETWSYLEPFLDVVDARQDQPVTFFEAITMLAFTWFSEVPVDVAVVEVGMGGTWDATNIADGRVAVIGRVGLDHRELGDTPAQVAAEKAGIIKPGSTVVSQAQDADVLAVIEARVAEAGATLLLGGRDFDVAGRRLAHGGQTLDLRTPAGQIDEVFLPLHGRHQAANAAAALAAVWSFLGGRRLDADIVRTGFAAVRSPGRLETVRRRPLVVLDGAHNPDGARALAAALLEEFEASRRTLVVGCLADKDLGAILAALAPAADALIVTSPSSPRAAPVERLRKEAEALGFDPVSEPDVPAAVQRAIDEADPDEVIVVTGSLYTVGEARSFLVGTDPG